MNLPTADTATAFAVAVSKNLRAGDCLLLHGPVGAGKTHFARGVIQAIMAGDGEVEDVPSPTFTLVQTYETSQGEIWHTDLYRLTHIDELAELGLEDALEDAITLIEWPDRLGPLTPPRHLSLTFSFPDIDTDERLLEITVAGENWDWLREIL